MFPVLTLEFLAPPYSVRIHELNSFSEIQQARKLLRLAPVSTRRLGSVLFLSYNELHDFRNSFIFHVELMKFMSESFPYTLQGYRG
jgi:hypothetical protein